MTDLRESRREQMFPKLTPAQIGRLEAYGTCWRRVARASSPSATCAPGASSAWPPQSGKVRPAYSSYTARCRSNNPTARRGAILEEG